MPSRSSHLPMSSWSKLQEHTSVYKHGNKCLSRKPYPRHKLVKYKGYSRHISAFFQYGHKNIKNMRGTKSQNRTYTRYYSIEYIKLLSHSGTPSIAFPTYFITKSPKNPSTQSTKVHFRQILLQTSYK